MTLRVFLPQDFIVVFNGYDAFKIARARKLSFFNGKGCGHAPKQLRENQTESRREARYRSTVKFYYFLHSLTICVRCSVIICICSIGDLIEIKQSRHSLHDYACLHSKLKLCNWRQLATATTLCNVSDQPAVVVSKLACKDTDTLVLIFLYIWHILLTLYE